MKIISILSLIFVGLIPFLGYSYPVYMSVFQNKDTNHAVMLWGDLHPSDSKGEKEAQFIGLIPRYLGPLLANRVPCIIGAEIHQEAIDNTFREISQGLSKIEELPFLQRLSIIATHESSPFIASWLGVDKAYVPFNAIDNRAQAVFSINKIYRISLEEAAQSCVATLLNRLDQFKIKLTGMAQQTIQQYIASLEKQNPLNVIDGLFFNQQFAQQLSQCIDIAEFRNLFIKSFIEVSKQLAPQAYSIHDLVKQIRDYYFYCLLKNDNSNSDEEQAIWAEACGMLIWIDEAITETFKPAEVAWGTPLTTCFINKAIELKSFKVLTSSYKLSERDKTEKNDIYKIRFIVKNLIDHYPDTYFLDQILMAANDNKHFVCIAGAEHCVTVSEWLQSLGYSKIIEYNYNDEEQVLNEQEIDTTFNAFINIAQ